MSCKLAPTVTTNSNFNYLNPIYYNPQYEPQTNYFGNYWPYEYSTPSFYDYVNPLNFPMAAFPSTSTTSLPTQTRNYFYNSDSNSSSSSSRSTSSSTSSNASQSCTSSRSNSICDERNIPSKESAQNERRISVIMKVENEQISEMKTDEIVTRLTNTTSPKPTIILEEELVCRWLGCQR